MDGWLDGRIDRQTAWCQTGSLTQSRKSCRTEVYFCPSADHFTATVPRAGTPTAMKPCAQSAW